ncbi:MAG: nitroreductase family protein [Clostridiales bacterium]
MDFYEVINGRESVREYDVNKKIKLETLKKIANAGRIAPSACNFQPWEFLIISSEDILEKVRPCYLASWFKEAPHILIVKGFRNKAWLRGYDEYSSLETDLTIAMDHMILAAENEGVATCWIAAFNPEILEKVLELKQDEFVYAITPLGYAKRGYIKKDHKPRKELSEILKII